MKNIFLILCFISSFSYAENNDELKTEKNKQFEVIESGPKNKITHEEEDSYKNPSSAEIYAYKEKEEYKKLYQRLTKKYPDFTKQEIIAKMQQVWNRKKQLEYFQKDAPPKTLNNIEDKKENLNE